jgi:hypothetical protein
VQNERELHQSIGCFAKLNAHLGLKLKVVNPAALSVAKLVDVMARARIVVGVSGEHVRPSSLGLPLRLSLNLPRWPLCVQLRWGMRPRVHGPLTEKWCGCMWGRWRT